MSDSLAEHIDTGDGDEKSPVDQVKQPNAGEFSMAHLPENLRGDTADDALKNVWGAYQEHHAAQEALGAKPERAEDYQMKLSEDAAKFFPDVEADPVIKVVRDTALELGLKRGEFEKIVPPIMEKLAGSGLLEESIDTAAEVEKLGEKSSALITSADAFVKRVEAKGAGMTGEALDAHNEIVAEMQRNMATADGVRMLNYLAGLGGETGPGVPGDVAPKSPVTKESIAVMRKDERYKSTSPKYDSAYRAHVDKLHKELTGG